jgi:hypothetical protein
MAESKLIMDGILLKNITADHDELTCKGCRLGNTGKLFNKHARSSTAPHGNATAGFTHFGQQMDSDICTSFPPSFPHLFTAMVNFIDRYGHETFLYFLRPWKVSSKVPTSGSSSTVPRGRSSVASRG